MRDVQSIISDLEQQRTSIDRAITALREVTGPPERAIRYRRAGKAAGPKKATGRKRRLTPAGRRRLSQLMKARWAAQKAAGATSLKKTTRRRKAAKAA